LSKFVACFLALVLLPAWAGSGAGPLVGERLCGYEFGGRLQVLDVVSTDNTFAGRSFRTYTVQVRVPGKGKNEAIRLQLSCPVGEEVSSGISERISKPSVQIAAEDAGGRYFRHVAWEGSIKGANWEGVAAHIDYLFGDGVRSPQTQYLVCQAPENNRCLLIEFVRKKVRNHRNVVRAFAGELRYQNP
jgi:hypothetical protein